MTRSEHSDPHSLRKRMHRRPLWVDAVIAAWPLWVVWLLANVISPPFSHPFFEEPPVEVQLARGAVTWVPVALATTVAFLMLRRGWRLALYGVAVLGALTFLWLVCAPAIVLMLVNITP
jgi:hypothetical protein